MKKFPLIFAVLMIASSIILSAQEVIHYDLEKLDAEPRVQSGTWLNHAPTGQREVYDLQVPLIISPDGKWVLFTDLERTGLDVETYKLYLLSLDDFSIRILAEGALGATFSPTSAHIFIATSPNPIIFDILKGVGVVLTDISSGLEYEPVWVSEWARDGTWLIIHRQRRFDETAEPRAWKINLW